MTDANLDDLDPRLKPLAEQFLMFCNLQFTTKIIVTYRSGVDQNAAHDAGLSNASAGQSPHNYLSIEDMPCSRAFDFAIFDAEGKYITDGRDERYANAGQIAGSLGLAWGGLWHHPDYDHVELANWRSLETA